MICQRLWRSCTRTESYFKTSPVVLPLIFSLCSSNPIYDTNYFKDYIISAPAVYALQMFFQPEPHVSLTKCWETYRQTLHRPILQMKTRKDTRVGWFPQVSEIIRGRASTRTWELYIGDKRSLYQTYTRLLLVEVLIVETNTPCSPPLP